MRHSQPAATIRATIDNISVTADDVSLASLITDAGEHFSVPSALLPDGSALGDVLRISIEHDPDETATRVARVSELQRKLFE